MQYSGGSEDLGSVHQLVREDDVEQRSKRHGRSRFSLCYSVLNNKSEEIIGFQVFHFLTTNVFNTCTLILITLSV